MIFKVLSNQEDSRTFYSPRTGSKTCSQAFNKPLAKLWKNPSAFRNMLPVHQVKEITSTGPVGFFFPAAAEEIGTDIKHHQSHEDNTKTVQEKCSAGKCGWKSSEHSSQITLNRLLSKNKGMRGQGDL